MNPHLALLLSPVYEADPLIPEHRADLEKSGLNAETIAVHKFRSLPPDMIGALLRFNNSNIRSAMLVPYPDPAGEFFDHIRLKIFPPLTSTTKKGGTVKYLQPRGSPVRLYFPLPTIPALDGEGRIWLVEGEKKSLAVAQIGLAAVGFAGIDAWHRAGTRELIPDFNLIRLAGRLVELVPDADWRTKPRVLRGALGLAAALETRGARVRLVALPDRRT